MKTRHIHIITRIVAGAMSVLGLASCSISDWLSEMEPIWGNHNGNNTDRYPNEESRKVMLLYSAGYNSLTPYLKEDIEDLKSGWLPTANRSDDIVLVYSHFPESYGKYNVETSPALVRLYTRDEATVADTLVVYPRGTISASAQQLNTVLTYVEENFPAKSYGMIFSSHATGYLPAGYYQKPEDYVFQAKMARSRGYGLPTPVPYEEPEYDPSLPMTKSIGQDQVGESKAYVSYEIELQDFAEAIPMELDYFLFDACLMGGIETAYELRDKVKLLGYSQTEVLAEGFNYKELTTHLLKNEEPDPYSVCKDYFTQYDIQTGVYRSATVSMIDCSKLDNLTRVCRDLFSLYGDKISTLSSSKVQQFFRSSYHWFYDMESILINAGATEEELARLHAALDECVVYKAHTPEFMNSFTIHTFCGFSMYLPSRGSAELDKYYKTLEWNKATRLVR